MEVYSIVGPEVFSCLRMRGARLRLKIAAMIEKRSAAKRQAEEGWLPGVADAKMRVTRVAPNVWPTSRAVPCIPPAPPERSTGTACTIAILLGVGSLTVRFL